MKLVFPVSYLSSQLSMTGLLVALGLGGNSLLAADVAIVQAAALALFYSFSSNARNLILKSGRSGAERSLFLVRVILTIPLGIGVYYLGSVVGGVSWDITLVLIARKSVEWLTEIHVSEVERDQDTGFAWRHLVIQSGLLLVAVVWVLSGLPGLLPVLLAWALVPLVLSFPRLRGLLNGASASAVSAWMLVPHLGSSAVMGIGVYVFRLIILLLVDKITAGNLFTAFAIGGVLGSVFTFGIGPSLVLHEHRTGRQHTPQWLRAGLAFSALAGLMIVAVSQFAPGFCALMGKDQIFLNAMGLSLIGGVVMVLAQRQRLRDLQNGTDEDVFAPDVLVNILIVAAIPFVFFAFGRDGLSWLYLFNATVALSFYWMTDPRRAEWIIGKRHANKLKAAIAILVVSPVFLTLQDGLFRSERLMYDSGGDLWKLPIPLSVIGCCIGIALLGNFRRANLGLAVIFVTFVLMILSTVTTTAGARIEERAKITLVLQYILPMFGLVLGMMYEDREHRDHIVEKSMLVVVALLVPIQLLASWTQGLLWLSPYLYLFSIYQHLQYVPIVLIGIYIFSTYALWDLPEWRRLVIVLAPVIGVYTAASASMLASSFLSTGCLLLVAYRRLIQSRNGDRNLQWTWLLLVLFSLVAYVLYMRILPEISPGVAHASTAWYVEKFDLKELPNVRGRIDIWWFYLQGIVSDVATFLVGHSAPPDRAIWPSAHNYYLDLIYNFGSVAALAIAILLAYTLVQLFRFKNSVLASSSLVGLSMVVVFLLFPDNLLKVGMRQPYSGVFTFFVWGLLLTRIGSLESKMKVQTASRAR